MVIKLKCTIFVHAFYVPQQLISFNVQALLLQHILTRISVALVPKILMTQKVWVIHGHHNFLLPFLFQNAGKFPFQRPRTQTPIFQNAKHNTAEKRLIGIEERREQGKRKPFCKHSLNEL